MSDLIKKYYPGFKALDVDNYKKQVKVAIAQMETVDRDNDVFDPSAWNKTIKDNGPKGSNEVWHLLDHSQKSFSGLGKFSELYTEGKYLVGVSTYKESMFAWREVAWPLYEAGDINQHSVGFEIIDQREGKSEGEPNIITQAKLYEGSAVLWGAQPDTPTMAVIKGLMKMDETRTITAAEKIDEIIKKLKNGSRGFNEDDHSLFIIELKRLQLLFGEGRIKEIFQGPEVKPTPTPETLELKTTQPETKTTAPDVQVKARQATIDCPSCLRFTYNTVEEKGYCKCHRCNKIFVPGGPALSI